ncbi:hypothetical protein CEXT_719571 [Caerostris extrusa]|uniref:Uncharacterized protein n=1 Tax=Caerostris extrusa TaxID=172846 RepID=A0AAV4PAF6_CAEEX|nr:hypothetical protein CEXT_719571 [Caerostris extrusa]
MAQETLALFEDLPSDVESDALISEAEIAISIVQKVREYRMYQMKRWKVCDFFEQENQTGAVKRKKNVEIKNRSSVDVTCIQGIFWGHFEHLKSLGIVIVVDAYILHKNSSVTYEYNDQKWNFMSFEEQHYYLSCFLRLMNPIY